MQRSQVFKVKGMQRDLSMANTNGEFAYEIVNMRLLPAEEDAGLSLTNEQGTLCVITDIDGEVLGQCPTSDSLIVFTHNIVDNTNVDHIYKISYNGTEWINQCLYEGDLNFQTKIEAIFNYETSDIQKVYWIDGINQLRCINLEDYGKVTWNDSSFDSVKQIDSLPTVEIERTTGGSFVAGVLQYYISYFTEFGSESPIVYTSPLLYLAHENRGGNVNDPVSTAFKLTLSNLDTINWDSIRIYVTHRTSLDATPEGSIIQELKIPEDGVIEVTDYGLNRVSIAPNDLYFIGGKFVKAGTMTVKDQVMFLGNLDIMSSQTLDYDAVNSLFEALRQDGSIDKCFSTQTRKQVTNSLEKYQRTTYTHEFTLNNTNSITHYKYGEKYRFGISIMDTYGQWSNPIWLKDEFIETSPEQISEELLELPCPSLDLSYVYNGQSILDFIKEKGGRQVRPLVVFPEEGERKVIAQGVVCPTIYNLKDRLENGPYAQASWFMRPNAPADLWGVTSAIFGKANSNILLDKDGKSLYSDTISHKSDLLKFENSTISDENLGYYGAASYTPLYDNMTGFKYLYDDYSTEIATLTNFSWYSHVQQYDTSGVTSRFPGDDNPSKAYSPDEQSGTYQTGTWVEFRHNYALRSKGWSFGAPTLANKWNSKFNTTHDELEYTNGMVRAAELEVSRFDITPPVNRFYISEEYSDQSKKFTSYNVDKDKLYFATTLSPKQFHKAQRAGKRPVLYVLYKHEEANRVYLAVVDSITLPEDIKCNTDGYVLKYYVAFGSPWQYMNIPQYLLGGIQDDTNLYLQLRAKRKDKATDLDANGTEYYIWEVRDITGVDKDSYITLHMPAFTISLYDPNSVSALSYGKTAVTDLIVGNSAYYIDNSIVTLNSPEIEFSQLDQNTSNSSFRIIGIIPLTATASDISLTADSPSTDSANKKVGLAKRLFKNVNFGYNGFKGIVGSNAYLSEPIKGEYSLVPLHPWQSTGTLGRYSNTAPEFTSKDLLKTKKLSNLRYSASTYYFPTDSLYFKDDTLNSNVEYLNNKSIGWKPANGSDIQIFRGEDSSNIIKLNDLLYTTHSLVYKGNIESIASMTTGIANTPVENIMYSFGDVSSTSERLNSPAIGIWSSKNEEGKEYYKLAQGASIKYKSSPHYVIGFKCFDSLWASAQKIQETLPAWYTLNEEGIASLSKDNLGNNITLNHKRLYEDASVSSLYHQNYISVTQSNSFIDNTSTPSIYSLFRDVNSPNNEDEKLKIPNYGWLWLGEIYRNSDPEFGGISTFALQNNLWNIGGDTETAKSRQVDPFNTELITKDIDVTIDKGYDWAFKYDYSESEYESGELVINLWNSNNDDRATLLLPYEAIVQINDSIVNNGMSESNVPVNLKYFEISNLQDGHKKYEDVSLDYTIIKKDSYYSLEFSGFPQNDFYTLTIEDITGLWHTKADLLYWSIGDTYYQRFDTLKTYAYSDSDQNSVIDITSFMVETRINIDGRYDRNRGQESNLQMSPTNFNLFNDIYNQKDNFFTYRILDDDVQNRTNFKNQITWSLSKTAGETIDSWLNVTLASVLDLDGTKGDLTALKTFGNNIVAFQDSGISQILFNSRVQIPTSENVPIQIANSGKVDGQQFITTDIGCQDKWNIVTTSQGLYFIDYRDKSIYKFNGQLANLSATGGFRGWCEKHITDQSTIVGYYDIKNKEVMFYDSNFRTESIEGPVWLGFSEMSNHFSSFYTYPEAYLTRVHGVPVWLYNNNVFQHQAGDYNDLLGGDGTYGLTINTRQDSNLVKTFNTVEFRADTYINKIASTPEVNTTFNTIQIESEYDGKTTDTLSFNQYRPSNLKKYLRTWRAQIPRVNNKYNRYVNQWAKIGLWMKAPNTEKTILHDMAVWYSE